MLGDFILALCVIVVCITELLRVHTVTFNFYIGHLPIQTDNFVSACKVSSIANLICIDNSITCVLGYTTVYYWHLPILRYSS